MVEQEQRTTPESWPPREVIRPCPTCGQDRRRPNGAFYRDLRMRAGVSLLDMARRCGVSVPHLSYMERGLRAFAKRIAEVYETQFERRPLPPAGRSPRHGRI